MRTVVVIPARFASTRLPGKPLLQIAGKPLLHYVCENARRARTVSNLLVATDDPRILEAARAIDVPAVLTSPDCHSGSDRVAEVLSRGLISADVVINLQGDEPELLPEQLDALALAMNDPDVKMATLACPLSDPEALHDPSQVKVVTNLKGDALYFSRAPIPCDRDRSGRAGRLLRHVGIYAYRPDFLLAVARLKPTPLEETEKLEQLRVLEHGYPIRVVLTDFCPAGIDTPDDLARFRRKIENP